MPQQPPQNPAQDEDPTRRPGSTPPPSAPQAGWPAATGETGARPVYGRGTPPPRQGPAAYGPGPGYGPAPGTPPTGGQAPTGPYPGGFPPAQVPYGQPAGGYGAGPGWTPGPAQGRVGGPATGTQPARAFSGPTGGFPTAAQSGATQVADAAAVAKKKGELTITKVVAGAGAAAASAIAGSFFGAMGTVSGAAAGAVFSSVVTEAMQRSLDKTKDTVKAKIKLPGGRTVDVEGKTEVPAPPVAAGGETGQARVFVTPGDRPTEVMSPVSATGTPPAGAAPTVAAALAPARSRSRRRVLVMAGFTVVIFALGMLAITGIELVKGSPLNTSNSTSQRSGGTSLGSVLGNSGAAATETSKPKATESATSTKESDEDSESARSTAEDDESAKPSAERGRSGASASPTPSRGARATPTPTPDAGSGGGAAPNARSGGAAQDVPDQQ
jgi:hypothetical protein